MHVPRPAPPRRAAGRRRADRAGPAVAGDFATGAPPLPDLAAPLREERPTAGQLVVLDHLAGCARCRQEFLLLVGVDNELRGEREDALFVQRALSRPRAMTGRAYWHAVAPCHGLIFGLLARRIEQRAAPAALADLSGARRRGSRLSGVGARRGFVEARPDQGGEAARDDLGGPTTASSSPRSSGARSSRFPACPRRHGGSWIGRRRVILHAEFPPPRRELMSRRARHLASRSPARDQRISRSLGGRHPRARGGVRRGVPRGRSSSCFGAGP